jgi:hypothetical protein
VVFAQLGRDGVWGVEWTELAVQLWRASCSARPIRRPAGRLGLDHDVIFAGMGVGAGHRAAPTNGRSAQRLPDGRLRLIYHPVGIPMLVQKAIIWFHHRLNGRRQQGIAIALVTSLSASAGRWPSSRPA